MIPATEIRGFARAAGVPESTIERDYAQNWYLKGLVEQGMRLVLKGGTGIRKTHIPDYRFSDDLDFGLLEEVSAEDLKAQIAAAAARAREASGIEFSPEVKLKENLNGFEGSIYFRILRASGAPLKIKLDFTRHGREILVTPPKARAVIHPYSDDCTAIVQVYSLVEVVAEKIRAMFERTRPRDLYDLWHLRDRVNRVRLSEGVRKKCAFKKVEIDLTLLAERKGHFESTWHNSLRHQLKKLPEFSDVFSIVTNMIEDIVETETQSEED